MDDQETRILSERLDLISKHIFNMNEHSIMQDLNQSSHRQISIFAFVITMLFLAVIYIIIVTPQPCSPISTYPHTTTQQDQ